MHIAKYVLNKKHYFSVSREIASSYWHIQKLKIMGYKSKKYTKEFEVYSRKTLKCKEKIANTTNRTVQG